jgi:DNA mismatch repair ATPase MutS
VIYHSIIKDKLKLSKEIIRVNQDYLSRIDGNWIEFQDIGKEFIDKKHRYSFDLDIVGEKSLFQLINITNTWTGRTKLVNALLNPKYSKAEIELRQEAVQELSTKLDFIQNMQVVSFKHKEELQNPDKLIEYAKAKEESVKSKDIKDLIYLIPVITIPIAIAIIIFKIKTIYLLIPVMIIIQAILWLIGFGKNNEVLGSVSSFKRTLETYVNILKILEKEKFQSKKLQDLKSILFNESDSSILAIKELDKISEKINLRYNNTLNLVLNLVVLWDYECVFLLEKWKKQYGLKVEKWIEAIGEIEALMSLSVLMQISENTSFPWINNSNPKVKAKTLGHPLINSDEIVPNDVEMDNSIFIITGSNMSGKTTFLRTLGINLVLAYSGAPVYAKEMECSILDIFTSMRITDDLRNGVSTFYAELLRIKDIIDYGKNNKMIFLIDEIFRGTNSLDRILGAKNVLLNLEKLGAIGAITTHDLELCKLDIYNRIKNYNFSEEYKDNKINFDYKIKEGKSNSTNAKYLMNLVGIEILNN